MEYELYSRANHYLDQGLIRRSWPDEPNPRVRREWMEWFLPRLSFPQRAWEAIHVAGTSGKGSVAVMVAEILRAAGVRTGLHVSPYLQVSTEKLWVDGHYASAQQFHELVEWIRPFCEACRGPHVPLHGMASVGVCLEHFRRRQVELGVMETGVGGRSDLTNVMQTRVAVISSVGLDHVKTLGPTLEQIAWHKAGIIKAGCRAVVLRGAGEAAARRQASDVGAPLRVVRPGDDFEGSTGAGGEQLLTFRGRRFQLEAVPLAMPGRFQAENAALAVAAVEELDPDTDRISADAVRRGLARARLPGRLERIPVGQRSVCPVILDGAHNPDKLAAMLSVLPGLTHERLHVVYGSLGHRTPDEALARMAAEATTLVLTQPRVYAKAPRLVEEMRPVVQGGGAEVLLEPEPLAAIELALARAAPADLVVVTGSLYLCGEVRERWYPAEQVVEHRASWY